MPVLLHVDPPAGSPISQLEQALTANRNAYNAPASLAALLGRHPNLYVGFFAGFTARNTESANTLLDFVPVIEAHRERFVVSTDSGYGVGLGPAIVAIYELLDLLTSEAACRVTYPNVEAVMEQQPPTRAQTDEIVRLSRRAGGSGTVRLNESRAHALIRELRACSAAAAPSADGIMVEPMTEYLPDPDCVERVRRMRGER